MKMCNTPEIAATNQPHPVTPCNTMQHHAKPCKALQHTATHCNTPELAAPNQSQARATSALAEFLKS